jgi:hypothetical protein
MEHDATKQVAVTKPLFGGTQNFKRGRRRNRHAKAASLPASSLTSMDPKQVTAKMHFADAASPPPPAEIGVELAVIAPSDDESSSFVRELKRMRVDDSTPSASMSEVTSIAIDEPVETKQRSLLRIPHIDPANLSQDRKLYYCGRIDTTGWAQPHVSASSVTTSRDNIVQEVNKTIDLLNIYLANGCNVPETHRLDERGIMQLLRSYLRNTALAIELDAIVRSKMEDEAVEDRLYAEYCTTVKDMGHHPYTHTLHTSALKRNCKSYAAVASKSPK